jgi:hypothetical protein
MKKYTAILLALLLAVGLTIPAFAQSYSFSLDKEVVHVYWNADGTLSLDYQFTFTNRPGAHPIDFVDVGLPNSNYNYSSITADVNGAAVSVSTDYQGSGTGVAVDLGAQAIQPGQTGTVHVYIGAISKVLYLDDDDNAYASAVFSPTWFGSQYVVGATDLSVTYHLPPGVQPEEPRWHSAPSGFPGEPQTGFDSQGRITYTWHNPSASGSTQYKFGASFPKTYIPETAIVTAPAFNFSRFFESLIENLVILLCCGFFIFMFVGLPIINSVNERRRKLQYLPPKIAIEGHGIKRGLTAVEAAILLEQPLDKVMTMILFGLLKKNAAQVVSRDPLEVQAADPLPEKLHEYEFEFVKAFRETAGKKRQKRLQDMTVGLVKSVSEKLRGFSRKETVDYYKSITEKAWALVEAENTPEVKSQKFDEALEWTMLDKNYDDRTRRVFTGPVILPRWWGNYNPTYRPASSVPTSAKPLAVPQPTGSNALPGADFAAQMVTGVQTFSQKVVGNINTFTESVTKSTNPPPKPSASRSGRSGGGGRSCACACACAGCACACAGGGR